MQCVSMKKGDMIMKIGVIAANGKVGRLIVKEALERGMDVTAIVRSANRTEAKKVVGCVFLHVTLLPFLH